MTNPPIRRKGTLNWSWSNCFAMLGLLVIICAALVGGFWIFLRLFLWQLFR